MTLPLNSRLSALYDTNGTQKDFSFGFRVFFDPDNGGYGLEVRRQTADGYEVIPKSDYLVLPVEDNSAGVVRFSVAPSAGQQIYIAGKTPTIQQLVLTNFGRYSAESIETQFDFITAIIQEWLSALGEETRQRMAADDILTQYVVQRIDAFVQQVNQNFDDKSQEIEDYIATIMPSFTQTLRDEIEAFAVAGMQDAIDQTLADSKAEIDDAVARANAAALAAAITGKVYDTPEAGVDPVTGVQNGAYYNVRSSDDDSYLDEYQNVGGVPTPSGKSYPSSAAVIEVSVNVNNLREAIIDPVTGEATTSKLKDSSGKFQDELNLIIFSRIAHIKDFGAIGDGTSHPLSERFTTLSEAQQVYPFATSLAEEIDVCAFQKMVNNYPSNATLHAGGLNLYFGEIQHAQPKVLIDSPENLVIHGVCKITCIAIEKRVVAIAVKNPRKFRAYDFYFKDPNFDIATQGGQYYGVLGIAFYADTTYSNSNPCGDIVVTGGADQMLAFVATEGAQVLHLQNFYNLNAIDNVEITATLKNCYYGLHSTYGSTNNKIRLLCHNVKRALNSYGMNGMDAFITLKCDAGFVGSDAFFELACEGGEFPNVSDVKAVIHVTGVEAHTAYATLYHQKPAQYGTIKNIDIEVWTKNLTTVGKNPSIDATNLIRLFHHDGTATKQTTDRFFDNLKLNTFIDGAISGLPLNVLSYPNNKSGRLSLGESLCNSMPQTGTLLTLWTWFDIQKANIRYVFEPTVAGATSAGTATYQRRFGVLDVKDKQATVNYDVQWTDHTGTGFIVVQRVPLISIDFTNGLPPVSLRELGFLGIISGVLDGVKDVQLYSKDATTGSVVRANVPASGIVRANFNFTVAKP